jgi:hypothetical protein
LPEFIRRPREVSHGAFSYFKFQIPNFKLRSLFRTQRSGNPESIIASPIKAEEAASRKERKGRKEIRDSSNSVNFNGDEGDERDKIKVPRSMFNV